METITQFFRPEFINRIDEVVVFHPLMRAQIRGIADIQRVSNAGNTTQEQISTGRRVLRPSDDPVAATRILQLNQ